MEIGAKVIGESSDKKVDDSDIDLVWRKENRRYGGGALVGKLMTEKDMNVNTVKQMIRKGWNLERKEDMEIVEMERKVFLFEFKRKVEYKQILRGRPWSINGWLLNIQRWEEDMVLREIDFDSCPFWIQFQDLPLTWMSSPLLVKDC